MGDRQNPFNGVVWAPRFRWLANVPYLNRWTKVILSQKIVVNREGVFVDGQELVRRSELRGASLTQDDDGNWFAHVWGRRSGSVTLGVVDLEDGKSLIRALNADAKSITAHFVLTGVGAGRRFIVLFIGVFLAMAVSLGLAIAHIKSVAAVVMPLSLVVMMAVVFWEFVRVTVGADGLVVRKAFSSRFIPHDRVLEAKCEGVDLVVRTADGELRWQMTMRRDAKGKELEVGAGQAKNIAKRIMEARAAYEELGGDATSIPALARAGKTTTDWLDALRRIGKDVDAGFRGGVVGRERLWMLVESTQVPPAYRVSAAVALRISGEDEKETTTRLREIAEACATPNLGKRLRVAASANEAELAQLLGEDDLEEISASRSSGS